MGTGIFTHMGKDVDKGIRQCGIGLAEYSNNPKRNEILQHLASAELPLDAGKVLSTLNAAGFRQTR